MKRKTKMTMTDAEREQHLHRLCEELGEDAVKKIYRAFELTAHAIAKRAKQRAEEELLESKQ